MEQSYEAANERLTAVLSEQGPLLRDKDLRQRAITAILSAVAIFLRSADSSLDESSAFSTTSVQECLALLLAKLGPGDAQVRETLLDVLTSLQHCQARQVILDFLPSTMPMDNLEEPTNQVIEALRHVLLKDPKSLLPVIECLSVLPVSELGRIESFKVSVAALPMVSETDLSALVRSLLLHISSEEEAMQGWATIREELRLLESSVLGSEVSSVQECDDTYGPLTAVVHVVLTSFSEAEKGYLLSKSYIKTLENIAAESDDECQLVDLVVLLSLSQHPDFCDTIDRIMDSWLLREQFPFDVLDALLSLVHTEGKDGKPTSVLYSRLAPLLLQLGIFLMLAPARTKVSPKTIEACQAFILALHNRLDSDLQTELVQNLLHLNEEEVWDRGKTRGRKRKRSSGHKNYQRTVARSVNYIIKTLAETAPTSLVRFKTILTGRLTSMSYSPDGVDRETTKELCSILSRVAEAHQMLHAGSVGSSELMTLLQKLLFSSSGSFGRVAGDSSRVVRGLLLATELIILPSLNDSDKECIKEWVLRILLPATRRMVDPELGSPGLGFLEAWAQLDGSKARDVFQHFKMVLSNTGLIQSKRSNRKDDAVLGYTWTPEEFTTSNSLTKGDQREKIFCVAFFLRKNNIQCPSRWKHSVLWVFELVDTYLKMGRKKATKGWKADGWLQASIEFPALNTSYDSSTKKCKRAMDWIQSRLNSFELPISSGDKQPDGLGDMMARSLDTKSKKELRDSVFRLTLSILTCFSLSSAVLKNAFVHYLNSSLDKEGWGDGIGPLIQFQMAKLYDLREKLRSVECLLLALKGSVRQRRKWKTETDESNVSNQLIGTHYASRDAPPESLRSSTENDEAKLSTSVDLALAQLQNLDSSFFGSREFIGSDVLWRCITDSHHDRIIRKSFETCSTPGSPIESEEHHIARRVIDLKCRLLDNLVTLLDRPATCSPPEFLFCIRSTNFLVDQLPKLRKVFAAQRHVDDSCVSASVRLATAYLRVIAVVMAAEANDSRCSGGLEPVETGDRLTCSLQLFQVAEDGEARLVGAEEIFGYVEKRLQRTDDALVANGLLEVLSIIALNDQDGSLLGRMAETSWSSLHTIYTYSNVEVRIERAPYALLSATKRFCSHSVSSEADVLKQVLEETVVKAANVRIVDPQFLFRQGLLRHWGLFARSQTVVREYFPLLLKGMGSFLEALESHTRGDEEKKEDDCRSPIPCLSVATFVDFFEVLLATAVANTAIAKPTSKDFAEDCGPYRHLDFSVRVFSHILDLFQRRSALFPKKVGSIVAKACQQMLAASVAQLHRSVDWRNVQPFTGVDARDPGAMKYLQTLLESVAAHTVGRILQLCDNWQSSDDFCSKSASLSHAAEKAARTMKDLASRHNLPPLTFDINSDEAGLEKLSPGNLLTRGFHEMENHPPEEDEDEDPALSFDCDAGSLDRDDASADGSSFGVAGDWGDGSDTEDENEMLDLQWN